MSSIRLYSSLILLAASPPSLQAGMTVSLSPSVPSPAPLGAPVTWAASVSGANPGTIVYRFRVWQHGRDFHTLVDYGPKSSLTWTTIDEEGAYAMEASVKNNTTGDTASATVMFMLAPIAEGGGGSLTVVGPAVPAVTPSANPLVYIYNAPACREGSMRVQFQSAGGIPQSTPPQPCRLGRSMNFYLAGMLANVLCTFRYILETGTTVVTGPTLTFTPPASPVQPPTVSLLTKGPTPAVDGILLQSLLDRSSVATDLSGNIVWYAPSDISLLTRPAPGGTFLGIHEDNTVDPSQQFFREFDLAGITIAETNAAQVNEQLALLGVHAINGFHHEARKLPNGNYLVLADSERILTGVQGPGNVDVIGDTILVLDRDLKVVWSWDAFDPGHLDTHRAALLGETCTAPNPGCAPWYLAVTANDWLHGNSLQLTPDGNILYSSRHQDWLIEIDYANGHGSGNVIWRLGSGGDFKINSSDASPWFSHQHDANFESDDVSLTVFDDGNTRAVNNPAVHSRGQLLRIDQPNRVATLILNADVGTYSSAVGSAQVLPNGDFHFDSGFIADAMGNLSAQSVEVNASGQVVYSIGFAGLEYRTFRMPDLYTAP